MRGMRSQLITIQHCAEMDVLSIGGTLADTLDDLISSRRIEPQLAIKIMTNFDKAIAQILGEKVKARMSFKVRGRLSTFTSASLSLLFRSSHDQWFLTIRRGFGCAMLALCCFAPFQY
jgi:hypothetical protein